MLSEVRETNAMISLIYGIQKIYKLVYIKKKADSKIQRTWEFPLWLSRLRT